MPWDRDGMSTPMQFSSNFHEESYANFPFWPVEILEHTTQPTLIKHSTTPQPDETYTHTHTHT